MDNLKNHTGITPESVLAVVQATTAEVKAMFAASRKELEQSLKQSRAANDKTIYQARL